MVPCVVGNTTTQVAALKVTPGVTLHQDPPSGNPLISGVGVSSGRYATLDTFAALSVEVPK